jgi:hypothetical protein
MRAAIREVDRENTMATITGINRRSMPSIVRFESSLERREEKQAGRPIRWSLL